MAQKSNFKDIRLDQYRGRYDPRLLHAATAELSNYIERQTSAVWRRIEAKTGLYSRRGRDKWGEHSSYFSQADLPQNKHLEGTYAKEFGNSDSGIVCDDGEIAGPSSQVQSTAKRSVPHQSAIDTYITDNHDDTDSSEVSHIAIAPLSNESSQRSYTSESKSNELSEPLFVLDYSGNRSLSLPESSKSVTEQCRSLQSDKEGKAPDADINDTGIVVSDTSDSDLEIVRTESSEVITINDSSDLEDSERSKNDWEVFTSSKVQAKNFKSGNKQDSKILQCENCLLRFADKTSLEKHLAYKKRSGGDCSLLLKLIPNLKQSVKPAASNRDSTSGKTEGEVFSKIQAEPKKTKRSNDNTADVAKKQETGNCDIRDTETCTVEVVLSEKNTHAQKAEPSGNKRKGDTSVNGQLEKKLKSGNKTVPQNKTCAVDVVLHEENVHEQKKSDKNNCVSYDSQASGSSGELVASSSFVLEAGQVLHKAFRCEYCAVIHKTKPAMLRHMKDHKHSCASSVSVDDNQKAKFTIKVSALHDSTALWQSSAIICPCWSCALAFSSPLSCMEHYRICHNAKTDNVYFVTDIRDQLSVVVSRDMFQCPQCQETFSMRKLLNSHMKSRGHGTYTGESDCRNAFLCKYCNQCWPTYIDLLNHLFSKHGKKKKERSFMATILILSNKRKRMSLPPFPADKAGIVRGINFKITGLRSLLKHNSRPSKKLIRTEIRRLHELKSSVK